MNLEVARTGGFAGISRTGTVEVDDTVGGALGEQLAALGAHDPRPDRFVYRLTLGERTVTVGEHQLPDELRELVDRALG
ncbi:hypothetical protein D9V37_15975 [Nocardioides mangrovicus]|uniref:Uncharacterized protein n=1 Tax=Nocardioides mangrovicus TaxID=2478913 RepID=A0A3L8NZW7_9ACTN|nr:protealysin inhibitor emfourin [Nocardioides mangrovicus]RLV47658.1 hypothetical protein D9V37_15975 [Nocardioides mangrovicus]